MHSFRELLRYIWRRTKTIVIFVVGVVLIVAGLIMLVVPGPGLLVIVAGLAVLATEFAWAEAMLDKAKEKAAQAGSAAKKGISRFRKKKPAETAEETPEEAAEPTA